jgi:glucosamine--fructose-6-phosphate aminotransferase (isomerizing)
MLFNTSFIDKIDNITNYIIEKNFNNIFILGKHKLYPIAQEASLKIKEVCYIHAEGFPSSSLKHGPFALLDDKSLTILLIDYNNITNYNNLLSTYNEIISRKTNIIIFTNKFDIENDIDVQNNFVLKLNKLDYYNEIIFIIALQYLSYDISIKKNINPDKPRNLAKVVTVE